MPDRDIALPVPTADPRIRAFVAHWQETRGSDDLPGWDIVTAMRRLAPLVPFIGMVEVRSPRALHIRIAGSGLCKFVGAELSGKDMLELTEPGFRDLRYRRFAAVASRPCGLQSTVKLLGAFNLSAMTESILLPYRRRGTDQVVVVSFHSLTNIKTIDRRERPLMPFPERSAYIDLGFGVPGRESDPGALWANTG